MTVVVLPTEQAPTLVADVDGQRPKTPERELGLPNNDQAVQDAASGGAMANPMHSSKWRTAGAAVRSSLRLQDEALQLRGQLDQLIDQAAVEEDDDLSDTQPHVQDQTATESLHRQPDSAAPEPHDEEPEPELALPSEAAPTLSRRQNSVRHMDVDGNTYYETYLANGLSETSWIDPEPGLSPGPSDTEDGPEQDTSSSNSNTSDSESEGMPGGVWNRESFLETQSLIRQLDDAIEQDLPSLPTADSESMVDV
jgi:hypothetical protein